MRTEYDKDGRAPRKTLRKLAPVLIVAAVAALVVVIAVAVPGKTKDVPAIQVPPVNVTVEAVRVLAELADTVKLPGTVEPNRVVRVPAEVGATIEKILVEEGRRVRKGQELIRLNTDMLKAELDRAAAQAEFDQRESERVIERRDRGVATSAEVDQARTRAAVSKAAFAEARARFDRTKIVAPIGGVLDKLPRELGEYVQAGDCVAEIVDIDTAKVVVSAPELDVQFFRKGQSEEVVVDFRGKPEKLTGEITYISELADEATRTTRVEISVANERRVLRSGRIVDVRLTRRILRDAIMVPLGAVIPLENGKVVYVVEGDKAARREVRLGLIKSTRVQVLSGLKAGDRLIVDGHRYVGPGQAVKVIDKEPEAAEKGTEPLEKKQVRS